jgi:prophage DNA circulation protein
MPVWNEDLLVASFAGFELHVLNVSDDENRKVGKHEFSNVNGALQRDRGAAQRQTRCSLIFIENADIPNAIRRFLDFRDVIARGEVATFVHPSTGAYQAHAEVFSYEASAAPVNSIRAEVTFFESITDDAARVLFEPTDIGTGAGVRARVNSVESAESVLSSALTAAGLESDTLGEYLALAQSWQIALDSGQQFTPRTIGLQLNEAADTISTEIARLELLSDIDRQPALAAFQLTFFELKRAADAVIAQSPRLTTVEVTANLHILAVVSDLYGGANAIANAQEVLELNVIPNPAFIPAGTILTVRAP